MPKRKQWLTAIIMAAVFTAVLPATAEAVLIFPSFFPPFAGKGTVEEVGLDGETCIVWRADSGGLFFFNGLEDFEPGDRLFVKGNLCLICLVALTCGLPVSPILNAEITPL